MNNRRSPVLVELIIIICFFSIALAVIAQMFAEVHTRNRAIIEQTGAIIVMQDEAEMFKADPQSAQQQTQYFNDDFSQRQPQQTDRYVTSEVQMTRYPGGTLYEMTQTAYRQQPGGQPQTVVSLSAAIYIPEVGGVPDEE